MVARKRVDEAFNSGLSAINNSQSPDSQLLRSSRLSVSESIGFVLERPVKLGLEAFSRIGPKLGPGSSSRSTKCGLARWVWFGVLDLQLRSIKQPWAFGEIVLSWRSPFDIRLGHPDEPIDPFDLAGAAGSPRLRPDVVKVRAEMSARAGRLARPSRLVGFAKGTGRFLPLASCFGTGSFHPRF